jgi:PAS domain S-box-containing protein
MAMARGADADVDGLRLALAAESEVRCRLERELLDTTAALQLSREKFHVLTQKGPVGILQADATGRCTYANERWCELTGLSPEETLGYQWSHAVHPDDVARVMEQWAASVEARRPYVNELRLVHRDGRIIDVTAAALPITADDGTMVGFIGTVIDVTALRAAERQLRLNESYLQGIADHAEAVIYLKDLEGRYLMVNRRWHELFSRGDGTIVGLTDRNWFSEPIAAGFMETDALVRETGEPVTREEFVEYDGRLHTYVSQKFPVLDAAGRLVATGGVSTNITEIKQVTLALAEKERILRRLIDIQETEKRTLCHEFHDGLIQHAVGAKMILESWLERHPDHPDADAVSVAVRVLADGIDDGRRTIRGIRPALLDDFGLEAAIHDLLDNQLLENVSRGELRIERRIDGSLGTLPAPLQTTIFRVIQESLTNVRRHSGSDRVVVELTRVGADMDLLVEDFGAGFDVEAGRQRGCGLIGMLERVRLAGGECRITSVPGRGTRVEARLRIATEEPAG